MLLGRRAGVWMGCLCLLMFTAGAAEFTYQGQLKDAGTPLSGSFDFQFTLFDAATAGNGVGAAVSKSAVTLTNGLFTVDLDFGATAFNGSDRWLEIAFTAEGGSTFATLDPRQKITPTPYAIRSLQDTTQDTALTNEIATREAGDDTLDKQIQAASTQLQAANAQQDAQITSTNTTLASEIATRSAIDANKVSKSGDTMSGLLEISTAGAGILDRSLEVINTGNGKAGVFRQNNINSINAAVEGLNIGNGAGVFGMSNGSGNGVEGLSNVGTGSGVLANTSGTGNALTAMHTGGSGEIAEFKRFNTTMASVGIDGGLRLSTNAGEAKVISIGERFRDNSISAWGFVFASANLNDNFGVRSVTRQGVGSYLVTTDATFSGNIVPIVVAEIDGRPTTLAAMRIVSVNTAISSNTFEVFINDGTGAVVDNDFIFIITGR